MAATAPNWPGRGGRRFPNTSGPSRFRSQVGAQENIQSALDTDRTHFLQRQIVALVAIVAQSTNSDSLLNENVSRNR